MGILVKKEGSQIEQILSWWLLLGLFFLPLFFVPWLRQPILGGKLLFLAILDLGGLLLWGINFLLKKNHRLRFCRRGYWLWLVVAWGWLGWFFLSSGLRVRSLLEPNPWLATLLTAIFIFLLNQRELLAPKRLLPWLTASGLVLSLLAIGLFLLPASRFPWHLFGSNPLFLASPLWSPFADGMNLGLFLLALFVFWLVKLLGKKGNEPWRGRENLLSWGIAFVFLVATGVLGYQIYQRRPVFLGFAPSWAVAVETLKVKPLFGIGPANFSRAFASYRPLNFNNSQHWALLFRQPANLWFQFWSEIGLLGLVLAVLFLAAVLARWRQADLGTRWLLAFLLLSSLLLPLAWPLWWFFLIIAASFLEKSEWQFQLSLWPRRLLAAGIALVVVLVSFFLGRAVLADYWFSRSLMAVNQNNGLAAYRFQLKAVRLNRFLLPYRLARSQTDLAMVAALVRKKEKITDQDRKTISSLVQEAIVEAKAGVALEPQSFIAWQNLARTYQQLINLAKGADQWAIAAYQQTISLNPFDPRLRNSLGGIYFSLGKYDQAARMFEIGVNLKPDYANGWYNWAWALKKEKKLALAVQKLQRAIQLVDAKSPDYQKAKKELEEWQRALGKKASEQKISPKPKQLSLPTPVPSPKITPIQLSKEAAPQIRLSPSPSVSP